MHLLAGLGNPGAKHANNRHNVGSMVVDEIHFKYGFAPFRVKFYGDVSEGVIEGHKVILIKPATFMNESGKSIGAAARFFKIPASRVVVFHDELDLPPGKVRAKTGGGAAGHNGLKSISKHISEHYRRVRIGIGHPGDKDLVTKHVLEDFTAMEMVWVEKTVDALALSSPYLLMDKDLEFASEVALIINSEGKQKSFRERKQENKESA